MFYKNHLLSPGPTPVPPEVLLEMAKPIIHHRTLEFSSVFRETAKMLKVLFHTSSDVLILASSGTGAMEASVSNLFSANDKVLTVNGGKFGERWTLISKAYNLDVVEIKIPWGDAVKVDDIKKALESDPKIKAVLMQASETSTTVSHPVKEVAAITKDTDRLLIVDGITSVGVDDIRMDDFGIDVLITGSQKALMLPPGLAMIALSEKAWKATEKSNLPKYYFNLTKERKALAKDTTAYTPAVSLIFGLKKSLELIFKEGVDNLYRRHSYMAKAVREAVLSIGLDLLAKSPANSATGILLPESIDGKALLKDLSRRYNVVFAGGQDHLTGKIIRIAHLGYFDPFDMILAVSALELSLARLNFDLEPGKATGKAESILNEYYNNVK